MTSATTDYNQFTDEGQLRYEIDCLKDVNARLEERLDEYEETARDDARQRVTHRRPTIGFYARDIEKELRAADFKLSQTMSDCTAYITTGDGDGVYMVQLSSPGGGSLTIEIGEGMYVSILAPVKRELALPPPRKRGSA